MYICFGNQQKWLLLQPCPQMVKPPVCWRKRADLQVRPACAQSICLLKRLLLCRRRFPTAPPFLLCSSSGARRYPNLNITTRPAPKRVHRYARLLLIVFLMAAVDFANCMAIAAGVNWCDGGACSAPEHRSGDTAAATGCRCRRQTAHQVPPSPRPL